MTMIVDVKAVFGAFATHEPRVTKAVTTVGAEGVEGSRNKEKYAVNADPTRPSG